MVKKVILFILLVVLTQGAAQAVEMKEGLWEVQSSIEVKDMPYKMPPQTYKTCITKKDMIPQQADQKDNQNCKITKKEIKGNTVSWTMECKTEEGKLISSGTITYRGSSFDGYVKIKDSDNEVIQKIKGKWLGKCPN